MRIFIAGTGRVEKCVIEKLTAAGHIVYCGSRHPETITETENCKPVQFDLQRYFVPFCKWKTHSKKLSKCVVETC